MGVTSNFPGSIKGSEGIIGVAQRKRVSLNSAQILALNSTPVTLVPAPGAGRAVDVVSVTGSLTAGTQYTGANAIELRYTNGSGTKVTGDLAAAWLNSATNRSDKAIAAAATLTSNAPVVVAVPTANPGAGTGTVVFDVLYRVVAVS